MKNLYFILTAFFLFSFGCKKENQELIFENGYTINEGIPTEDYRNKFEGFYALKCSGTGIRPSVNVSLLPTRPTSVILRDLLERGYSSEPTENLISEIDSLGNFEIKKQVLGDGGTNNPVRIFTGSGQILHALDSITINLNIDVGIDTFACTCAGKRN